MQDFNDWLRVKGFDPETITATQKTSLSAAWRAELNPALIPEPAPRREPAADQVPVDSRPFNDKMNAIEAEAARVETIQMLTEQAAKASIGNPEKRRALVEIGAMAIADQKTTVNDFKLALLRADRWVGPMIMAGSEAPVTEKIVEAAVCRTAGMQDIEKHYDARTLEASDRHFKHGLSLVGLLHHAAQRNGWHGMPAPKSKDFLRAAFGQGGNGTEFDLRAGSTGPSTYSVPNIVGNIANKFLKSGWLSVDSAWMQVAYRRPVSDFKTITTARLNGALIFRTLAPGGEIKHGTFTESTYTNRASTTAIIVGITREDIINDDLGAFTELSRHVGRGAGLKVNDLFWTVFLNNSSFFTSGNANVSTGGGSALGTADGAAINAAEVIFINQDDPNGYPIALAPRIMLVPPTLANTARRWMGSFGMVQSGTAGLGDSNIFQGRYSIATSPYMENTSYTGNSTAAWYLLADPNDEATIEGVALDNRWEPTVETGEADFNQLGIAMRGYIDVGFAFKEPRAGVRSAGS